MTPAFWPSLRALFFPQNFLLFSSFPGPLTYPTPVSQAVSEQLLKSHYFLMQSCSSSQFLLSFALDSGRSSRRGGAHLPPSKTHQHMFPMVISSAVNHASKVLKQLCLCLKSHSCLILPSTPLTLLYDGLRHHSFICDVGELMLQRFGVHFSIFVQREY